MIKITPRERSAILKSLGAGVVPEIGLHHLVVGRKREIGAICSDLDAVKDGGAAFRIVVGPNGAGKTFLAHLSQHTAIQDGYVVVRADLGVNHRLHGKDGKPRALFGNLMANLTTKACPHGNGLRPMLEAYISGVRFRFADRENSAEAMTQHITKELRSLKDFPGGFEFAEVLGLYYEAFLKDDARQQDATLRWLRAEYSTKTEAREELGVRRIINDEGIYDALKLFAAFCRLAGYKGLIVMLDELSSLTHRLPNATSRQGSVQVLLTIFNDCLQGGASGLGFLLSGLPECLSDPDRGLYSFPALRSRLEPHELRGCVDYSAPVIKLAPLGPEELVVLLQNVRCVHANGDETRYRVPDEALNLIVERAYSRSGTKASVNTREVVRGFVSLLNFLEDHPERRWQELVDDTINKSPAPADEVERELGDLKLH